MLKRTTALCLGALALTGLLSGCNLDEKEDNQPMAAPQPKPMPPAPAPAPMVADGLRWDSMAFPTGERATSTLLLERGMPVEVVAGQEFCFKFRVTNLTNMSLQNVTLRDEFGPPFSLTRSNPQGMVAGNVITWNLGNMGPRETKMVEMCGRATGQGRIQSCAVVDWNSLLCGDINVVQPALKVEIAMPPERSLCEQICARIVVTNTGSGPANNTVVTFATPAGWTLDGGRNTFDVGTLGAGQSRSIDVCGKAQRTGTYTGTATAAAAGGLQAASGPAQTIVRQPVLEVTLACPQGQTFIGRTLAYEATVANKGDGVAANTMLMVSTPAGLSVQNASDNGSGGAGGLSWNVGNLAPGQSKKVSFVLNPGQYTGQVPVSARATAVCANEPSVNCTSQIVGIPAQLLNGVDNPDPVQVGGTTTYTLTVTNQGSQPLTNVALTGKLVDADKMQYVSAAGPTGAGQTNGADVKFPNVPTLGPGQSVTYTVVVKATGDGQVSFEAQTTSDQVTRPLVKRETTTFFR